MGKLDGKVAVVTGASSGIGEATALTLAQEGAHVIVAARRTDRLQALVAHIKEQGHDAQAIPTDVANEEQASALIHQAYEQKNHIDILVNSAGVMQPGPIERGDPEDWRAMFDTNVLGLMYITKAIIPLMKSQGGGYIVNISSTGGRVTTANLAVYTASKHAITGFSDSLRKEVCLHNIRVTTIEPGAVSTELPTHIRNPEARELAKNYLSTLKRLESEDVAASVLYVVTQPERVQINEILLRPVNEM